MATMHDGHDDRNRDRDVLGATQGTAHGPTHQTARDAAVAAGAHTYTEKRRRGWLLPLALLALLALGLFAFLGRDRNAQVADRATTTTVSGGEVSGANGNGMLPIAAILANPAQYGGQTVSGSVRVTEVVSDRGFWIEGNGQRMFVVLGEKGAGTNAAEHHTDVKAGQVLRVSGHVYTSEDQVPGGVEDEAEDIIEKQKAFLHVMPGSVQTTGA
jgi:hypothetical protein